MKYAETTVSRAAHDRMLPNTLDKADVAAWCAIAKRYTARAVIFCPTDAYQADYINRKVGALSLADVM